MGGGGAEKKQVFVRLLSASLPLLSRVIRQIGRKVLYSDLCHGVNYPTLIDFVDI